MVSSDFSGEMRNNTPPSSPFFEREDMMPDDQEDDGEDDELVYVGDGKRTFLFLMNPMKFLMNPMILEDLFEISIRAFNS